MWQLRNGRVISAVKVSLRIEGYQLQTGLPISVQQYQEGECPSLVVKSSGDVSQGEKGLQETENAAFKGHGHKLICDKLWHGQQLKMCQGYTRRNTLINFRVSTGGAGIGTSLSGDRSTRHFSFVECSSDTAGPAQVGAKSVLSVKLANTIHPTQEIP